MRPGVLLLAFCSSALTFVLSCDAATQVAGGDATIASIEWVCTTEELPWQEMQPQPAPAGAVPWVKVYPEQTRQTLLGFGGCFNERGWVALQQIPAGEREDVMKALFDDSGCGFTRGRVPVGASDFAVDWYSLDETPGDLALKDFSIGRDRKNLIPYIKSAMKYQKDLDVFASAWSPPTWMKTTGQYNGGSLKQTPEILDAYARYLAKFARQYRAQGVNLSAVHVQNEPTISTRYPSCVWTPAEVRDFIRDHLGPVFDQEKVEAQIWLGTMADANFLGFIDTTLSDPGARKYVKGCAFQYSGLFAIADTREHYPDQQLIQSENVCHSGLNSFADAEETFGLMLRYLNDGASAYFYWNMVLDDTGMSAWEWRQNAMVTIDTKTRKAVYNPEFYVMQHFAHYVKPGAKRIVSSGGWADRIAFLNPDGSVVLVIGNRSADDLACDVALAGEAQTVRLDLPGNSISTVVLRPAEGQ